MMELGKRPLVATASGFGQMQDLNAIPEKRHLGHEIRVRELGRDFDLLDAFIS